MVMDVMMIVAVIVLITRIRIMVVGRGCVSGNGHGGGCDCDNSDVGCGDRRLMLPSFGFYRALPQHIETLDFSKVPPGQGFAVILSSIFLH